MIPPLHEPSMEAIGDDPPPVPLHHVECGAPAGLSSAEYNLPSSRGFAGPKIPYRWVTLSEGLDRAVVRMDPTDFRPPTREFGFEVTVKVIGVWPPRPVMDAIGSVPKSSSTTCVTKAAAPALALNRLPPG